MSRLPRFGSALSALALAGMVGGCATPSARVSSATAAKDIGLATRAQVAVSMGDFAIAVQLAERAVEITPDDATVRALLGNAYFGAGRFASAEAAYRDSLTLAPNQPKLALKLALVDIAQGKSADALGVLAAAQHAIDPADLGLAMALAGQPGEAISVLEPVARRAGADGRVRQNLALAYALAGDWTAARTIAAQDLTPDLVESRVRQWMQLANPSRPSDQVAALIGVTPAVLDPGQPVRLALRDTNNRFAQLAPVTQPRPQMQQLPEQRPLIEQSQPQRIVEQPQIQPTLESAFQPAAPQPLQATPAILAQQEAPLPAQAAPAIVAQEEAPLPVPPNEIVEPQVTASAPLVLASNADPVALSALRIEVPEPAMPAAAPEAPVEIEAPAPVAAPVRHADEVEPASGYVVQLAAYASADRVMRAWEQIFSHDDTLRHYVPARARFESDKGTVYRLSVKGFTSVEQARDVCSDLRRDGKSCFVRKAAGDAPVQFASR